MLFYLLDFTKNPVRGRQLFPDPTTLSSCPLESKPGKSYGTEIPNIMTTFPSGHQSDSRRSHRRIFQTNLANHTGRPHGHSAFKTYTVPLFYCAELYAVVGSGSFNNTATTLI